MSFHQNSSLEVRSDTRITTTGNALDFGDLQTSQNKAHTHGYVGHGGDEDQLARGAAGTVISNVMRDPGNRTTDPDGGTEARPDSLVLNAFVKPADLILEKAADFRAYSDMLVVSATV